MKVSDNNENTKDKILNVAEALFAEKGFDGTSMGEIAKQVGINKASIYYYFESKDKLLEEILKNSTIGFIKKQNPHNIIQKKEFTDEDIALIIREHMDFLKSKKNILIIGLTEALKQNSNSEALFNIIDLLFDRFLIELKGNELPHEIDETVKLKIFLFKVLPVLSAAIFDEKLSKHYGLETERFNETIIDILTKSYKENIIGCNF